MQAIRSQFIFAVEENVRKNEQEKYEAIRKNNQNMGPPA